MLNALTIKNFALIDQISIEFDSRLNVLTGETGAGKSILIDALRFVLGERLEVQPQTGKTLSVEAVFDPGPARKQEGMDRYLESEDDLLILRREVQQGKSRCFINGRTVNVSDLKEVGRRLIDIHGQYDHQLLFDTSFQTDLLDRLAKNADLKNSYAAVFGEYHALLAREEEIRSAEAGRERELDLLKFQIEELEAADLEAGEEEKLQEERIRMNNSEKLYALVAGLLEKLNEGPRSASSVIAGAWREMSELARIDESTAQLKSDYETLQLSLEEIIRSLTDYHEGLAFDPERLKEVDERLDAIHTLKRKYGATIEKVLEFQAVSKKRFDELANAEVYLTETTQKISSLKPKLKKFADELTEKRKKTAAALRKTIEEELKDLGIANAQFSVTLTKKDPAPSGQDEIEFMMTLNAGQEPMALRKIVSAGEVSRVMLAMKRALMKVDQVQTLIFDEIDANIGGRLGTVTGRKLKEIAGERQVLLITHLPQIASFADRHFKVTKKVSGGRTVTDYHVVDGEARVKELAQMMSGKNETEVSLKHAEEMLSRAR